MSHFASIGAPSVLDDAIVRQGDRKIHLGLYIKMGEMDETRQKQRYFNWFHDELVLYIKMGNLGDAL
jgi:hypothetical protein